MLTLKSKTPLRFEWGDGVVETTVTLYADDTEDVLIQKLKRVVALVEGDSLTPVGGVKGNPFDYHPEVRVLPVPTPVAGNGWAAYAAPEVPDHLKGEVELIDPEVSNG